MSVQTDLSREARKAARKAARRREKDEDSSADQSGRRKRKRKEPNSEERPSKGRRQRTKPSSAEVNETSTDDGEGEEYRDPLADESASDNQSSQRGRERLTNPLPTIVHADDDTVASQLFTYLQADFALVGLQLVTASSKAGLIVSLGSLGELRSVEATHAIVVVLGGEGDLQLLRAAAEKNAIFLPTEAIARHYCISGLLDPEQLPGEVALRACASAACAAVLSSARGMFVPAERNSSAPDVLETSSLASNSSELLKALNWRGKSPPGSIRPPADIQAIEGFLDGEIKFRTAGGRDGLGLPYDWRAEPASRAAADAVFSLNFLAAVLSYWFQKANRSSSRAIGRVDALVKERELTASAVLSRANDVMLGLVSTAAALPEPAWQLKVVMRRARAMLLYLLCCRAAAERRIKFDEQSLAPVFRELVVLLEQLRWAGYLELGKSSAVARAASIAGLALPLRNTEFGKNLLEQALQAVTQHLEVGLSSDGVWREGFVQHDAVFRTLKTLSTDLQTAEVPSGSIKARLTQMAQFVFALLRDDGHSPPLPSITPKKYRFARAAAQSLLRSRRPAAGVVVGEDGLQEAKLFPEAGFFVSRSVGSKGKPASHFVLHAAPTTSGGQTLSFCCGASPVLVGGGTADRKASVEIRRATQWDPAAHNALRVGKQTYREVDGAAPGLVQVTGVWEEKSWAAAQLVNRVFAPVAITRTAIHLKPLHALLTVDELRTGGEPLQFEQFWHLAPGLELRDRHPPQFHFTFEPARTGGVAVAFDRAARIVLKKGGSGEIGWTCMGKRELVANPYFIREITTANGLLASFFRCVGGDAKHEVSVTQTDSGWKVLLVCTGRQIAFVRENNQLKLVS
jgi:hypothetical protein